MTDNALDSVRLILNARRRVTTWGPTLQSQALLAMPYDRGAPKWDMEVWLTAVAVFASPDELPVQAARRLAKYLLTYQENHGRMPTLSAVQKHAADRKLKEPR